MRKHIEQLVSIYAIYNEWKYIYQYPPLFLALDNRCFLSKFVNNILFVLFYHYSSSIHNQSTTPNTHTFACVAMDIATKTQRECEERVAEEYLSSLSDLNCNSKPLINMLTMLAEENIEYAAVIVKVVEQHIAKVNRINNFLFP